MSWKEKMNMARTYQAITISFEPEMIDKITKAAKADKRSRSNWVNLACEEKLARDTLEIPKSEEEGER